MFCPLLMYSNSTRRLHDWIALYTFVLVFRYFLWTVRPPRGLPHTIEAHQTFQTAQGRERKSGAGSARTKNDLRPSRRGRLLQTKIFSFVCLIAVCFLGHANERRMKRKNHHRNSHTVRTIESFPLFMDIQIKNHVMPHDWTKRFPLLHIHHTCCRRVLRRVCATSAVAVERWTANACATSTYTLHLRNRICQL